MQRCILFIVPPNTHLLDLSGAAHIFYEAKEYGADLVLNYASINQSTEIKSSAGLSINKLTHFSKFYLKETDFIIIPGIDYSLISNNNFINHITPFLKWLGQQHARGVQICSICTGAFLVAESGILSGRNCTTHWKYLETFKKHYPKVKLFHNRLFIRDKNIYSSAGVSSGIDISLFILEELYGAKLATDIAKEVVVYFRRSNTDPQLSIFLQYRNHLDNRIHEMQDYIISNLHASITIDKLAEIFCISSRNLTRVFKFSTGITIGKYIEKLRVEKASQLLIDGHKVDYVTQQVGLKSTNQLRTLIKKYKNILPSAFIATKKMS